MEIKLTDEQVNRMVKQSVDSYVRSQLKPKIDKVIKDNYHFHQSIAQEMRESVDRIMREKIEVALNDKQISNFIDSKAVSKSVADAVLDRVSEKISEAVQDTFY